MTPSAVQSVWRTFALNPKLPLYQQRLIGTSLEKQGSLEAARIIAELWRTSATKPEAAELHYDLEINLRRLNQLAPEPETRLYAGRVLGL